MNESIPRDHPRYKSLALRALLENGLASGITSPTGLVAHGRGEAFDYLLGEQSREFSREACRAAAAMLLQARKPVISVNGNTAVLVRDEFIALGKASGAALEINLFHDAPERREKIAAHFKSAGVAILGVMPDALIPGLSSARARVDSRGMQEADVVLVSLEDGDRTAALVSAGKKVIAIDLNPLSRTPKTAQISIVDNVVRAIPLIEAYVRELEKLSSEARNEILRSFNNNRVLEAAEVAIRKGFANEEKAN